MAGVQCPFCSYSAKSYKGLASHFRHNSDGHPDYKTWKASIEPPKIEGVDYVTCQVCQSQMKTLRGHLKRKHELSADEYRQQYPGHAIHSSKNAKKQGAAARQNSKTRDQSGTKVITCPQCDQPHEVSKYFVPVTHDATCPTCKTKLNQAEQNDIKASGTEGIDYVTCLECGHVAANLTSHLMSAHDIHVYRQRHPNAPINAEASGVRDKSKLLGRKHSPETIEQMRVSAGWNRGLTAETDERVARMTAGIQRGFEDGRETWSKGLTSDTHPSLQSTSESLLRWNQENERDWESSLKKSYTLEDFEPYLNDRGEVMEDLALDGLDCSYPTLLHYMGVLGLQRDEERQKEIETDRRVQATIQAWEDGAYSTRKRVERYPAHTFEPFMVGDSCDALQMAEHHNCHVRVVHYWAAKQGISYLDRRTLRIKALLQDLKPLFNEDGGLEVETAALTLGCSVRTVWYRCREYGIPAHSTGIPSSILALYTDSYGRVDVLQAAQHLNLTTRSIRTRCRELNLQVRGHSVFQHGILMGISKILDVSLTKEEYTDDACRNPDTGRKFRYDGYYEWICEKSDEITRLLVESHGYQHYTYPNVFHKTQGHYDLMQERDVLKKHLAQEAGFRYLVICENEPYKDDAHLRLRLEGVLGKSFWEKGVQPYDTTSPFFQV